MPFKEPAGGTPVVAPADDPPKPEPEVVDIPERSPDAPKDKFSPADGDLTITRKGFVDDYCKKKYPN